MTTLVVDQRSARLGWQTGALVIRVADSAPRTVPLRLLERVVLAASVTIESGVLSQLAANDISLLAMPARGNRRSAFLQGYGHGDAARRLGQYQMVCDDAVTLDWARRFVGARLRSSRRLVQRALVVRPDQRRTLSLVLKAVEQRLARVEEVDTLDALRGVEGAASAAHFKALAALFAQSLGFRNRNRRPPRDPVNAALSLGYTLAQGDAIRALAQAGLDPMLGFLHDPSHNRESLACDLVETARASVEELVWRLFADKTLRADSFVSRDDGCLLGKAARGVFFAAYERHAAWHRRGYRRYAQALANACSAAYETTLGA